MIRLLLFAAIAGTLGALIGAIGVFILTEGLPEGAIMGGILGGSIGMLVGARLDALRAEKSLAMADPESAKRSAALISARERQIRDYRRDIRTERLGLNPLKKLEEYASDAEQSSDYESRERKR